MARADKSVSLLKGERAAEYLGVDDLDRLLILVRETPLERVLRFAASVAVPKEDLHQLHEKHLAHEHVEHQRHEAHERHVSTGAVKAYTRVVNGKSETVGASQRKPGVGSAVSAKTGAPAKPIKPTLTSASKVTVGNTVQLKGTSYKVLAVGNGTWRLQQVNNGAKYNVAVPVTSSVLVVG